MRIGTVAVPGSRAFLVGTALTAGVVALVGVGNALVPLVGAVVFFLGWAVGLAAGVTGGGYASWAGEVEGGRDGAAIGGVVGLVGNLAGAVASLLMEAVAIAAGVGESPGPPGDGGIPGGVAPTPREDLLVGLFVVGGIGLVTGTVTAAVGGAIGGFVGTRL